MIILILFILHCNYLYKYITESLSSLIILIFIIIEEDMRHSDHINIITGEIKKVYPINSTSKRFASLEVVKEIRGHHKKSTLENLPMLPFKTLGTASDSKAFKYNYIDKHDPKLH